MKILKTAGLVLLQDERVLFASSRKKMVSTYQAGN